jgi:hypothetical protein
MLSEKSITVATVVDGPFIGLFLCKKTIHILDSHALGWWRESGFAQLVLG